VQAWDLSIVRALFDQSFETSKEELAGIFLEAGFAVQTPTESIVADQDWVSMTQNQFDPIQIGERIWIVPSWHQKPSVPGAICLAVDPGLAFGTGSHPTTRLCLEWLEQYCKIPVCKTQTLLDYGCGSGILAIAAKKLGFQTVFGTDIDPQAIESARTNANQNQTEIEFQLPDDIDAAIGSQPFDVVIANILANPLQVLAPALIARVKDGGQLILSGILERQAQEVIDCYKTHIPLSIWRASEGWVCLHGQKPVSKQNRIPNVRSIEDVSKPNRLIVSTAMTNGAGFHLRKPLMTLGLLIIISFLVAISLWRIPILHFLAPSLDKNPSPIALRSFELLQTVDRGLCEILPCDQRAVIDFKAWRFLLANLGMDDSKRGEVQSLLQIELQNRLLVSVAIPHLELTLSDADEKTIARILMSPEEWLPKTWQSAHPSFLLTGAPPKELFNLSIPLQLPANAAGYRLRVAYPSSTQPPSL
jgi:ribosomal protein L11 methyltransferase